MDLSCEVRGPKVVGGVMSTIETSQTKSSLDWVGHAQLMSDDRSVMRALK